MRGWAFAGRFGVVLATLAIPFMVSESSARVMGTWILTALAGATVFGWCDGISKLPRLSAGILGGSAGGTVLTLCLCHSMTHGHGRLMLLGVAGLVPSVMALGSLFGAVALFLTGWTVRRTM